MLTLLSVKHICCKLQGRECQIFVKFVFFMQIMAVIYVKFPCFSLVNATNLRSLPKAFCLLGIAGLFAGRGVPLKASCGFAKRSKSGFFKKADAQRGQ